MVVAGAARPEAAPGPAAFLPEVAPPATAGRVGAGSALASAEGLDPAPPLPPCGAASTGPTTGKFLPVDATGRFLALVLGIFGLSHCVVLCVATVRGGGSNEIYAV